MANPKDNKPVVHSKKHIARLERERLQTRLILYSFIGVLVIVIGLVVYGYLDQKYFQQRRPVAKIGNVSIPVSEWQARVRMQRTQLINQLTIYQQYAQFFGMDLTTQEQQILSQLNDSNTLGESVLNQMIDEELIRQEAAKRGITASDKEVEDSIQASYSYYPNGTPTPSVTPTAAAFPTLGPDTLALVTLTPTPGGPTNTAEPTATASLAPNTTGSPEATGSPAAETATPAPTATATSSPTPAATATPEATFTPEPTATPYTQQGFDTAYKTGVSKLEALGLTEAQVRQLYAVNILRQKLMDQVTSDTPRTEEQVWARHILVADEATAKQVRQRLLNGEDFSKLAAELSTDTGTKDKGGDLGWFPRGQMVAEFETAAFGLKVGEISQPVKSQFGYHIIQVLAHANVPLSAAAYQQTQESKFATFLKGLRDQYKVTVYNNWQNLVPVEPAVPASPQ